MKAICIPPLDPEQLDALEKLYRTTRNARLRTRAQMVLLAAERRLTAAEISEIVRTSEETVRRWLKRYLAEGVEGLRDEHASWRAAQGDGGVPQEAGSRGAPSPTQPGVAVLLVDLTAPGRPHGRANRHPGDLRERASAPEERRHRLEPPPAHHHEPRPSVRAQKKAVEETRDGASAGRPFLLRRRVQPELDAHAQGHMGTERSTSDDPHARPTQKALRNRELWTTTPARRS